MRGPNGVAQRNAAAEGDDVGNPTEDCAQCGHRDSVVVHKVERMMHGKPRTGALSWSCVFCGWGRVSVSRG